MLREVRRDDALLTPEGSSPDLSIAIIEQSLASRVPAVVRDGALGRLWRSPLIRAGLLRAGRPGRRAGRQDPAGRPAPRPARRRRREDRSRGEPQDGGPARAHRAAKDPAPRRRLPAMTMPRSGGRLFRKYVVVLLVLVGGVLMASSLVELYFSYRETQVAIVRVERAKAVAAAAGIEQFMKEVEQQVRETTRTASDDPDASQVGQGRLGFRRGPGRRAGGAARARLPPGPSQCARGQRAEPSRPRRQGAASRLSSGPGCRRQPGGLLPGAQVPRSPRRARRTGVRSTSRTIRSRT